MYQKLILVFCCRLTPERHVTCRALLFHLVAENQRQELRDLILEEFAYAWDCVRPSLANYGKYNTAISGQV